MEPPTQVPTPLPADAVAIATANKLSNANTTAIPSLNQPILSSGTAAPLKKKTLNSCAFIHRTLVGIVLKGKKICSHLSADEIVACVNFVCADPAFNPGAGGEEKEPELNKQAFTRYFENFMGKVRWPKKWAAPTAEYNEALNEALEAHGAGKKDLILKLADFAAKIKDIVIEKRKEEAKSAAAAAAAASTAPAAVDTVPVTFQFPTDGALPTDLFAAEGFTGLAHTGSSVPASDSGAGAGVNAMEVQASKAAVILPQKGVPFLKSRPAVPITTVQGIIPNTAQHQVPVPGPVKAKKPTGAAPIEKPCLKSSDGVGLMPKQGAPQVSKVLSKTAQNVAMLSVNAGAGASAAHAPVLRHEQPLIFPACAAEKQKKYREWLQKKREQEEYVRQIEEAELARRRVEAGKKRKRENEERLAALESGNEV